MVVGAATAAMIESLPAPFVSVKGRLGRMTTEIMEVFSLEENDQILYKGDVYRVISIDNDEEYDYMLRVVDEEGMQKKIGCDSRAAFRLIVDTLSEV